jgi:hypothetical protein
MVPTAAFSSSISKGFAMCQPLTIRPFLRTFSSVLLMIHLQFNKGPQLNLNKVYDRLESSRSFPHLVVSQQGHGFLHGLEGQVNALSLALSLGPLLANIVCSKSVFATSTYHLAQLLVGHLLHGFCSDLCLQKYNWRILFRSNSGLRASLECMPRLMYLTCGSPPLMQLHASPCHVVTYPRCLHVGRGRGVELW